jgi:hypothetical protein
MMMKESAKSQAHEEGSSSLTMQLCHSVGLRLSDGREYDTRSTNNLVPVPGQKQFLEQ